jgi:DNA modification methylase
MSTPFGDNSPTQIPAMGEPMNKAYFGDCRETMRQLVADGVKVQTCVTSPPYYGLRDYGCSGQIGLESTPEEYVRNMVDVFRLVRELLADDGTLWLNIGDSYARNAGPEESKLATTHTIGVGYKRVAENGGAPKKENRPPPGLKPKDLIGIPWMLAFALRADGWILRQDIIWHKPNPMPESVRDRCTKAHEYIFLLSKSQKYFFDSEAMKEKASETSGWAKQRAKGVDTWKYNDTDERIAQTGQRVESSTLGTAGTRNRRSVWTVATQPYKGAHFATFPPALIEPCILAGSRPGDIVLDPFFGSGTVAQVAEQYGRQWIGCELNPDYAPLQRQRVAQSQMYF